MNFNVKWCYKKQISLLLDCYLLSQNVSTYILTRIIQHLKNNFMSFQPVFVQFWEKVKVSKTELMPN
jgi:hypothetical protein